MVNNIVMGLALNRIPEAIKQRDGLTVLMLLAVVAICVDSE